MKKKVNLGVKQSSSDMVAESRPSKEPYYPSFYIENKELSLTSKDVSKTFKALVTVKLKSRNERVNDKDKSKKVDYSFDVHDITFDIPDDHASASPMLDRKSKY